MKFFVAFAFLILILSCGVPYKFIKTGSSNTDTSFIYNLPYPNGTAHLVIQGYNSLLSHKGRINLDFKMEKGSRVTASRAGIVISVQEGYSKGGLNKKYLRKANSVIIRHSDGTSAMYGHLRYQGAEVEVGEKVVSGQLLGYSGSVGFSAFPHLHFVVWGPTPKGRSALPTRFHTRRGAKYLRPGRWYRSV
jgi:murein DD-endopeptidase MepM/ murein hydrolase activator NlpD